MAPLRDEDLEPPRGAAHRRARAFLRGRRRLRARRMARRPRGRRAAGGALRRRDVLPRRLRRRHDARGRPDDRPAGRLPDDAHLPRHGLGADAARPRRRRPAARRLRRPDVRPPAGQPRLGRHVLLAPPLPRGGRRRGRPRIRAARGDFDARRRPARARRRPDRPHRGGGGLGPARRRAVDRARLRARLLPRPSAPRARREVRPRRRRRRPLRIRGPSRRAGPLLRREPLRRRERALHARGRLALRRQPRPHGLQRGPFPPPRARAARRFVPRGDGRHRARSGRDGPLRRARRRVRRARHLRHDRPVRLPLLVHDVALARHRPRRLPARHRRLQDALRLLGARLHQPLRMVPRLPRPREPLHRPLPRRRARALRPRPRQRRQPRQLGRRPAPRHARRAGGLAGVARREAE